MNDFMKEEPLLFSLATELGLTMFFREESGEELVTLSSAKNEETVATGKTISNLT